MPKISEVKKQRERKDPPKECDYVHPGGVKCAEHAGHKGDHEPPILEDLHGSCKTALLVRDGVIQSSLDEEGWHRNCNVAIIDGRGVVFKCACPCHEAVTACLRCAEVTDELDPTTFRCLDVDACAERFQARLEANPKHQQIRAIREAAAKEVAEKEERAPRVRTVKEGRCHHCGEPTKGGKFIAGHDMKLKGELIRASQEGDAQACAELMARGWYRQPHHAGVDTEMAADKIIQSTPTHVLIEARNEARWSK